jgi:RNA polymerase sigma factor (sigma-70 family)
MSTATDDGSRGEFGQIRVEFVENRQSAKKQKMQRSPSPDEQERALRILEAKIEFISSDSFSEPGAAEEILGELPQESVEDSRIDLPKAPRDTPPYLAELYAIPLLVSDEERNLFRGMNFLKFLACELQETIDAEMPRSELLDQIEAHLADAQRIRNHIVGANLRLVVSIAKTVVDAANEFDTLVSDGNVPLIRAVELFDFERGTRFSTYATWAIRNSLYRSAPRNRRQQKRFATGSEGIFEAAASDQSTEQSDISFHQETKSLVARMVSNLDDRDRRIVSFRFGLEDGDQPLKFREISEQLGISTERVRQLLVHSVRQLRELAEREQLEPVD